MQLQNIRHVSGDQESVCSSGGSNAKLRCKRHSTTFISFNSIPSIFDDVCLQCRCSFWKFLTFARLLHITRRKAKTPCWQGNTKNVTGAPVQKCGEKRKFLGRKGKRKACSVDAVYSLPSEKFFFVDLLGFTFPSPYHMFPSAFLQLVLIHPMSFSSFPYPCAPVGQQEPLKW